MQRRGHSATVATLGSWRDNVERAGVEFRPIRPDMSPDDPAIRDVVRNILDPTRGPDYLFKDVFAPAIEATYADTVAAVEGADLLVSHQLPQTAPIVAERTGIKWVSGVVAPFGFLSAYDPPTPPQAPAVRRLIALHPAVGRAFNQLARAITNRWMAPLYRLRATARAAARGPSTVRRAAFSGVRAGVVLGSVRRPTAGLPAADGDDGVSFLRLCPDAASRAGSTRVPRCGRSTCRLYAWIFGRVDRRRLLPGEHRRRYVRSVVARCCWSARMRLRFAPRCQRHVGVFDYAPHTLVMPRASVIVHQGGIGTTGQALRAGRPTLVVPFGQDQPDNARRVRRTGRRADPVAGRYTAESAHPRAVHARGDPTYDERARTVGARIAAERGVDTACDAIEKQLRNEPEEIQPGASLRRGLIARAGSHFA